MTLPILKHYAFIAPVTSDTRPDDLQMCQTEAGFEGWAVYRLVYDETNYVDPIGTEWAMHHEIFDCYWQATACALRFHGEMCETLYQAQGWNYPRRTSREKTLRRMKKKVAPLPW
jgi:hypothetical protein